MKGGGLAVILMYHRIAEVPADPFSLCVTPQLFYEHMQELRRTWRPIPFQELASAVRQQAVPDRGVVVTFDDGYVDNLTNASPALMDCGLPAMFFVTTGLMHEPRSYWWDALAEASGRDEALIRDRHARLWRAPLGEREACLREWIDPNRPLSSTGNVRPMLVSEIVELARRPGHMIGAHTVNHLYLPTQVRDVCVKEMRDCKLTLEGLLARRVESVAYPFGALSSGVAEIAAETGYACGVTAVRAPVTDHSDLLALPRVEVTRNMTDLSAVINDVRAVFEQGRDPQRAQQ